MSTITLTNMTKLMNKNKFSHQEVLLAQVSPKYLVVRRFLEVPVDLGTLFLLVDLMVQVNL